ncbi:MAG: ATP-binding cassette domain-containing protein [Alphaproteobacteria bacterium]|nr:ATP-binding cassette domain-containing protein [Alphaproteobacteria bacterium]
MPGQERKTQDARRHPWLWDALSDARGAARDTLLVSLFVNLLALATPVFVLQVYDRVVFHAGLTTLQGLVFGMALVVVFDYVLRRSRSKIFQSIGLRIDVVVGRRLFDKILNLPLRVLEGRPSAYWQSLFRDIDVVRNAVSGPTAAMAVDLPFAILFFILIFIIAAPVAWVLVVALVLFMALAWRAGGQMGHSAPAERQSSLSREELLNELVAGRATVKALALADGVRPRWESRHAEAIAASQDRGEKTDGHQILAHVMMTGTTVAMTTVGALAILGQEMTIGALIAANMLGGRMIAPMTQLVGQWRSLTQTRQAMARLDRVFALPEERGESPISLGRPNGTIRLETVSFGYSEDGGNVLDKIDGRIGPGGMHGIIGRNGCGKSTLLKIIAGLYAPDDGRVMLDDADILQFTRAELSRWIGYMPQECVLFSGSIRDNIRIADPGAPDDAVIAAAKVATAHQFIIDLPDGYASDVGEAGANLSRGQLQRIALARAFLGAPPVLLLDEPTSNLDNDAEREIAKALQDMARQSTVLVVTHSPVLLAACGTLLVLDSGRVAMAGPAPAVLQQLQPQARQLAKPAPQSSQAPQVPPQTAKPPQRPKRAKRAPARTRKKTA